MQRTARSIALGTLFELLGVGLAHAVMPPWVYQEARAQAPYHIQVAIDDVTVPAKTPGDCQVSGKVVEIFRDTSGKLSNDQSIVFPVACIDSDDRAFPGGTIWTNVDKLKNAHFIEVYLVDTDNGFDTAKWQSRIIDKPSPEPQFPVE